MKEQSERGEYWIFRYLYGTSLFDKSSQQIDLYRFLSEKTDCVKFEKDVFVGKTERVPARLIACRLPIEVANIRRSRLRDNAQKHLC